MDEIVKALCCLDRIDTDTLWYGAGSLQQISPDLATAIEDAVEEIKEARGLITKELDIWRDGD